MMAFYFLVSKEWFEMRNYFFLMMPNANLFISFPWKVKGPNLKRVLERTKWFSSIYSVIVAMSMEMHFILNKKPHKWVRCKWGLLLAVIAF